MGKKPQIEIWIKVDRERIMPLKVDQDLVDATTACGFTEHVCEDPKNPSALELESIFAAIVPEMWIWHCFEYAELPFPEFLARKLDARLDYARGRQVTLH